MTSIISPQEGKQKLAANTKVDFMIYGGARGSGKSYLLNMLPLKHIKDKHFQAIFFRRQYDELIGAGGLWDTANELYPKFGAQPNITNLKYTFPAGSDIRMKHMFTEADKERHRGLQYSMVGFDEIDHFSKEQVTFLMTCLRSKAKMDSYMVGTCNPNPDSWVLDIIEWYLDDRGFPVEEKCGVIRYFVVLDGDFVFADSEEWFKEHPEERIRNSVFVTNPVSGETTYIRPKTFTFINGNVFDNPALIELNPAYVSELQNLPDHERDRQLWGNWYARPTGANFFQRDWLNEVEAEEIPWLSNHCRAWDKAATQPNDNNKSPDYTACSPRFYMREGLYYMVWDMHDSIKDEKDNDKDVNGKFRKRSGARDLLIKRQAQHDGEDCHVIFPVDAGAAGKTEFESSAKQLIQEGFVVKSDPMPTNKSKIVRFQPFASACQNGLVHVLRSSFPNKATYDAFMKELESFDGEPSTSAKKDDWADATASAFNYISRMKTIKDFPMPKSGGSPTLLQQFKSNIRR